MGKGRLFRKEDRGQYRRRKEGGKVTIKISEDPQEVILLALTPK